MSFEESLKNLTESNKRLAESNVKIAEANEQLGVAMTEYAGMLRSSIAAATGEALSAVGGAAASESAPKKQTAAEKKAAAEVAAAKKAAEDAAAGGDGFGDDGFGAGEDAVPDKLDGDMVKAKLLEVRDAYGDKVPALRVIKEFGYNAIPDVKPADYEEVYKAACKAIKAAPKK